MWTGGFGRRIGGDVVTERICTASRDVKDSHGAAPALSYRPRIVLGTIATMCDTTKLREVAQHHHDEAAGRRKQAHGYFVQAERAEAASQARAAKHWRAMAEAEQAVADRQQAEADTLISMADAYDASPEPPARS